MVTPLLIVRMRRLGMKMPYRTARAAHRTGLNLPLACSILMEETGGGTNEFGRCRPPARRESGGSPPL